jgi:hypothetical protein
MMMAMGTREGIELTTNPWMTRRVHRLIFVSSVALGVITGLAVSNDGPTWAVLAIAFAWFAMPTALWASVDRPVLRYLLVVPALSASVGLIGMAIATSGVVTAGWLIVLIGISTGGMLGMWFWYRFLPVPYSLDDPYGTPRLSLLAIHIALVLIGIGMIVAAG